jgi:hypothetical protein
MVERVGGPDLRPDKTGETGAQGPALEPPRKWAGRTSLIGRWSEANLSLFNHQANSAVDPLYFASTQTSDKPMIDFAQVQQLAAFCSSCKLTDLAAQPGT